MKYVTYWYQFFTICEELVPILHSVKFAKCEICGSKKLVHGLMFVVYCFMDKKSFLSMIIVKQSYMYDKKKHRLNDHCLVIL